MNKFIVLGLVVLGLAITTSAFAATFGKQIVRGTLFAVVEEGTQTQIYKVMDGSTTCYVAQFGKSGVTMSCVK